MRRRQFLSRVVLSGGAGSMVCVLSGCGSLMHSERVGRSHSHNIDWKVAALDGLGMLFFFVPGVIAFAVDFYTGAIYLPHGESSASRHTAAGESETQVLPAAAESAPNDAGAVAPAVHAAPAQVSAGHTSLRSILVPGRSLTTDRLEQIVSQQTGCKVSLQDPQTRLSELSSIDGFDRQFRQHQSNRQFGFKLREVLERVRPA